MMNYYVIIHVTFSQESLSPAVCLHSRAATSTVSWGLMQRLVYYRMSK